MSIRYDLRSWDSRSPARLCSGPVQGTLQAPPEKKANHAITVWSGVPLCNPRAPLDLAKTLVLPKNMAVCKDMHND